METLRLENDGAVARMTLDRAEKRNALSALMIDEFFAAFDAIEAGPARAAVVTGAGRAFCAGMDLGALRALAGQTDDQNRLASDRMARLFLRVHRFPKPLVAAVNGPALAGGCGIATMCDITLAAPEARFGYTEVRIGFIPAIVSVFLVRQVGEKRARDLLLTGRIIEPEEARAIGLVSEIVAADRLMTRADEIASALAAASPTSLARTKRLLVQMSEAEIDREVAMAVEANTAIRATADFKEGLSAFLEKRAAVWRGE